MKSLKDCFCVQAFKALLRSSSTLALVFLGLVFGSQNAYADDINITLQVSPLSEIDLLPEVLNTTSQTVTVETNSPGGYNVKIETNGNPSDPSLIDDDTGIGIPTITLPVGAESISSSSFGYGYGYSLDGANYKPAPGIGGDIFGNRNTANAGSADSYQLTYGVKVPIDQAAGTYSRVFLITASVNEIDACLDEYICYNKNYSIDDRTTPETMEDQYAGSNAEVTLNAPIYRRPGYGFVGWNTNPDGNGTFYGPNQTITTGDLSEKGLTLYAIWLASSGSIQSWGGCDGLAINGRIALTDSRDGNVYVVAKLADGQCWMTENLRLNLSDPNVQITAGNTNNPTANFMMAVNTHPQSTSTFCTNDSSSCMDQIQYNNLNMEMVDDRAVYAYGGYYNWYTSTAGNGTRSYTDTNNPVNGDICPKGWRLPTGRGNNGRLRMLDLALGGTGAASSPSSNAWRSFPANFVYSGEFNGGTLNGLGLTGHYQSSTVNLAARANNLWMTTSTINANANGTLKNRGQSIRCMAINSYKVEFDENTAEAFSGDMSPQEFDRGISGRLNNNLFKVLDTDTKGYRFVGWNTKADGTGTYYADGATVNNLAVAGGTITLYAQWEELTYVQATIQFADEGTLGVSFANSQYGSTTISVDGGIAKLVSGKTYNMSINLAAGYDFVSWEVSSGTIGSTETSTTTFVPNGNTTIIATTESGTDVLYLQDVTFSSCTTVPTVVYDNRDGQEYVIKRLEDGECWMMDNLRLGAVSAISELTPANTNISTTGFALPESSAVYLYDQPQLYSVNSENISSSLGEDGSNKVGVYYNYCAASAGKLCSDSAQITIEEDICPAGWSLPDGNKTTGMFVNLLAVYGGNYQAAVTALSANFSGYYNASTKSVYNFNKSGYYWSKTAYNANKSFMLETTNSRLNYTGGGLRSNGLSIRCVLK